jgi:superfamily II DNA or RNA helicase
MSIENDNLLNSLQAGFINQFVHSKGVYLPQILVNDKKSGIKVLSTIQSELMQCDEFWFSVAFVTNSGVASLFQTLLELEERNIKGKLLVSQYLNFTQPEALKRLSKFKNIELKIVTEGDFHSKGYLFKNNNLYDLIIGSSNLTQSALSKNKEWNLKVTATPESHIIVNAIKEFKNEFENAHLVTKHYIDDYEQIYKNQFAKNKSIREVLDEDLVKKINPNSMQKEALARIKELRENGKDKALLISATGTGKTYLSAFDAQLFNARKLLFVVHRENITRASLNTFKSIFGNSKTMGLYTGNEKNINTDFVFSTVQTISKEIHLSNFDPKEFDYIVIDEAHHATADSYKSILNYFKPKFLLGMTATPERTDDFDVFKLFDYNIASEIRLHRALEEEMLSPFHYYGISDFIVNNEVIEDEYDFNSLTSDARVNHIIEASQKYSCDSGVVRGLVFCRETRDCKELADKFSKRGFKSKALLAENNISEREEAILKLESEDLNNKLDYIFTVDVFNEGVDIPKVNQVVMLRPTQSAIIFVQQLGRGLRKSENKEYLTVLDFIGNFNNNYILPMALFGDTSYNKDKLRKLMVSGNTLIPGESTINFDKISKERIFQSIDSAKVQLKKDLISDFNSLKAKIGKIPMMIDFIEHGSRDPYLYVEKFKSFLNFVQSVESSLIGALNLNEIKLLELFSSEVNNAKRIEESYIVKYLIFNNKITFEELQNNIKKEFGYDISYETFQSCIRNINFQFVKKSQQVVVEFNNELSFTKEFNLALKNPTFKEFLMDNLNYSIHAYKRDFDIDKFNNGFVYNLKYSRKDVCRILNWAENEESTIYGYRTKFNTCPLFVTYKKKNTITDTTKYEDKFLNNSEFQWLSRSKKTKESSDLQPIIHHDNKIRLLLFVQKSNDEGSDFYYIGDVIPREDKIVEGYMDEKKKIPIVSFIMNINQPVEDGIYNYLTDNF